MFYLINCQQKDKSFFSLDNLNNTLFISICQEISVDKNRLLRQQEPASTSEDVRYFQQRYCIIFGAAMQAEPLFAQAVIFVLIFPGTCAGSTKKETISVILPEWSV